MNEKQKRSGKYSAEEMGRRAREIGSLGVIPILLAVGPIIGALIGQWLDRVFDTSPLLTILFVIFGFVAAVREMMNLLKQAQRDEKDTPRSRTGVNRNPNDYPNREREDKDDTESPTPDR